MLLLLIMLCFIAKPSGSCSYVHPQMAKRSWWIYPFLAHFVFSRPLVYRLCFLITPNVYNHLPPCFVSHNIFNSYHLQGLKLAPAAKIVWPSATLTNRENARHGNRELVSIEYRFLVVQFLGISCIHDYQFLLLMFSNSSACTMT